MNLKDTIKYYVDLGLKYKNTFPFFHPTGSNQKGLLIELNKVFEQLDNELKNHIREDRTATDGEQRTREIQKICMQADLFALGLLSLDLDDKSPETLKLLSKMTASYGFLNNYEVATSSSHPENYAYYIERLKKGSTIGDRLKIMLCSGLIKFFDLTNSCDAALSEKKYLLCICYTDSIIQNQELAIAYAAHIYRYLRDSCLGEENTIGKLNKYYSWLSDKIAEVVLMQYPPADITMDIRVRRQIFELIENRSWLDDVQLTSDKDQGYSDIYIKCGMKFMYLDNMILMATCKEFWNQTEKDAPLYSFSTNMKSVCWHVDKKNKYHTTWMLDDHHAASIYFETEEKEILLDCNGRHYCFTFFYRDYALDYYSKDNLQAIFESKVDPERGKFAFSLVSLQNYREPKDFYELNFDNTFRLHKKADDKVYVTKENEEVQFHAWLYGQKINSINCIVGKNGTGKTSIIDFLRDIFFSLIDRFEMECMSGKAVAEIFDVNFLRKIGVLDDFRFLVVFKLQNMSYLFTNHNSNFVMKELKDILHIYDSSAYLKYGSIYQYTSVAYFSGKVDYFKLANEDVKNIHYREITSDNSEEYIVKELFAESRNMGELSAVESPLLQARLAMATFFRKILSMESEDEDKEGTENGSLKDEAFSDLKPRIKKIRLIDENDPDSGINEDISKQLEDYIRNPVKGKKLAYFSSGEYSFFSFFSRIYWFFGGWKDAEELRGKRRDRLTEADRPRNSTGSAGSYETVVLCIDEGDLYYHPEWERKFVDYLLKIIDESDTECSVQIVITTNSPFMLSDIMHEDVQYLFDEDESEESKQERKEVLIYGQNIHTLLSNTFFLTSTIGEFSLNMIGKMFDLLANVINYADDEKRDLLSVRERFRDLVNSYFGNSIESPDEAEAFVTWFIAHIGEPMYSRDLQRMYEQYVVLSGQNDKKREQELNNLKKLISKRDELDAQIRELYTVVLK